MRMWKVATDFHLEVVDHARAVGDRLVEGYCLYVAGVVRNRQNEAGAGADLLLRALAVQRATGDEDGQATTLDALGGAELVRGDLRRAVCWWEEILDLGESPATISALINLGLKLPMLGTLDGIDQLMDRAEALIDQEDNRPAACVLTISRAQWNRMLGRFDEAMELVLDAERLAAELRIPRLQSDVGYQRGCCHLALNSPGRAAQAFEQALEVARPAGLRDECSRALRGLAEAKLVAGDPLQANRYAEEALEFAGQKRRLLVADGSVTLAKVELALGNVDAAITVGEHALAVEREVGFVIGQARALELLAEAYAASNDSARNALATKCADEAHHIYGMFSSAPAAEK